MYRLNVHDSKYEGNSFSEENENIFPLLLLASRVYGEGFVSKNWDALLNHQKVDLSAEVIGHKVSVQIAKTVVKEGKK